MIEFDTSLLFHLFSNVMKIKMFEHKIRIDMANLISVVSRKKEKEFSRIMSSFLALLSIISSPFSTPWRVPNPWDHII